MNLDIRPIFLFSLPRSGSTLSQRILAAHPEIGTVTEPCILLPLFFSLRDEGVYANYGHQITARGIQDFCAVLPKGQADYLAEIREFALHLYAKASNDGSKYFVDKTPNYSYIASEIIDLFPEAKFIFLWRNPLAIVSSLITMWHGGRWSLYHYDAHLYDGLASLVSAYESHKDHVHVLQYEKMLSDPVTEWSRIFAHLGLSFDAGQLDRFSEVHLQGRLGDHIGRQSTKLSQEPVEKWKQILANPIRKAWCGRYLEWIGQERLAIMGYDKDELLRELKGVKPSLRFIASDFWWMPYSGAYRFFGGNIIKHQLNKLISGQHVHIHH